MYLRFDEVSQSEDSGFNNEETFILRRVFCADFGAAGLKFSSFFVVAFACVFMVFQRDKMYS